MRYPDPTPQDVHDGLLAARALMNGRGGEHWIQRRYRQKRWFRRRGGGGYEVCRCSSEAIDVTAGRNFKLRTAMLVALTRTLGHRRKNNQARGNVIVEWNDRAERTWADVSAAFRKAARDALRGRS